MEALERFSFKGLVSQRDRALEEFDQGPPRGLLGVFKPWHRPELEKFECCALSLHDEMERCEVQGLEGSPVFELGITKDDMWILQVVSFYMIVGG